MDRLRIICEDWGVPLAEDKTIGPSFILTFRGLEMITICQNKIDFLKWKSNNSNSFGCIINNLKAESISIRANSAPLLISLIVDKTLSKDVYCTVANSRSI
jgi:hypothetical protein